MKNGQAIGAGCDFRGGGGAGGDYAGGWICDADVGAVDWTDCGGVLLLDGGEGKAVFGYDDSLDAFGVHGAGGTMGAILTGVFAQSVINPIFGAGKPVGCWKGTGDKSATSWWACRLRGDFR